MGFLDFFSKKKSTQTQIDYTDIILKSWDIFRQGLKNPNPQIRRAVEEAVWYVDNPEGKRYFATGMQEPDLDNKAFCLQKLYERGGWRLAENILKIALNEEEIPLDLREQMIYYIGGFSDSNAAEFLIKGLESKELRLRIASIAALAGVKNGESMNPVYNHLQNVTDSLEKFVCGIVLYQYNHPEGKSIVDSILKNNGSAEYVDKLRYLDFNKAKPFLEEIINHSDSNNKNVVISMIDDNRGVDILKKLLKDSDPLVIDNA
ncbi:HEAT repeat domain-containing protein, partial [bacterium]